MEYAKTPFAVGGTTTWIGDVANQAGCLRLLTLDAWWCDLQPWLMAWSMSVDEHPTKLYIVVPAALHEIHWNTAPRPKMQRNPCTLISDQPQPLNEGVWQLKHGLTAGLLWGTCQMLAAAEIYFASILQLVHFESLLKLLMSFFV